MSTNNISIVCRSITDALSKTCFVSSMKNKMTQILKKCYQTNNFWLNNFLLWFNYSNICSDCIYFKQVWFNYSL